MTDRDEAARKEILARLVQSREELRSLLDPPRPAAADGSLPGVNRGGFPRSRTMRMLMSGRGLGTLGAVAAGLFMARPSLALRLLGMVPADAVARMLIQRAVTAFRPKPD